MQVDTLDALCNTQGFAVVSVALLKSLQSLGRCACLLIPPAFAMTLLYCLRGAVLVSRTTECTVACSNMS